MSDEIRDGDSSAELESPKRVPRRELLKVDNDEIEAVMLVPVPPHRNATFDEYELRTLLANAFSITIVEKIEIIVKLGTFNQRQVNALLDVLRRDRMKYEVLNDRHNKRLEEWEPESRPTMSDLTAGETAGIVYQAIGRLLAPIGAGDAQKFFTAFLQRLAWQIEQGGAAVIEGELPAVFEPELRNSELNPHATEPAHDMRFIKALVRPALSKLRRSSSLPVVYHRETMFVVAPVIEGAEQPRGRVKQRHRVGVFVRIDSEEAIRLKRRQSFLRGVVEDAAARGHEILQLERFGPFTAIIRKVVEQAGYKTEEERRACTFSATVAVLGDILAALRNDQRLQFLTHLLELPLWWTGTIPSTDFDTWFLNAIDLNGGISPEDENFDRGAGRFQASLRYAPFPFSTQLLLLKAYHIAPWPQRAVLTARLRYLDEARVRFADADTIYYPPPTIDLKGMLQENVTDVADFLRLAESLALDYLTSSNVRTYPY